MGWAAVVTAVSTAVIALAIVGFTVGVMATVRRIDALARSIERLVDALDRDGRPALEAVRRTADEAGRMAILVRDEVEGVTRTSKKLRARVDRTARSLEERYIEFETLVDLLQDELEGTALDVAAALRTTRRGSGLLRSVTRAFRRRR